MKRHLFYSIIILLTAGLVLTTCNKDYFELNKLSDEIELEPSLVAPLAYGSMNLKDIVERIDSSGYIEEFTEEPNIGLLYLAYRDSTYSVRADTMVDVPNKLVTEYYFDSDINIPTWLTSSVGDTVPFLKTEFFTFELDGNDRVDSIQIKGGEIVIDVMSSFEHTGLLTISSPQILDVNRDTFSTVIDISDPGGNFVDQKIFFSDGYCIKSEAVNDTNFVRINFKLDLINSGSIINPDDQCEILTSFNDMDFYSVFGFIDSRDLIVEGGSFEIALFEENPDLANIIFNDPRINIFTSSSVGIPMEIELDSVFATSSRDGSVLELNFTKGHPFVIGAPEMERRGERVESVISINKDSSNIDALLGSAPSEITYKIKGRTEVGDIGDQHFILDTSRFDLALEFLLPLDFKSSGFALHDTIDFDMEDGIDTSLVKLAQVTVTTSNELPIELGLQVYFLDMNETVVDSVFDEETILLGASQVDDQGELMLATDETNSVTFTTEKLSKLQGVAFMQVEARMITSELGDKFVKLFSDYSLDFEISMLGRFKLNTNDLP